MDFGKLKDLIGKCKTANYQAGVNAGRAEVAKDVCKSFDAELEWYLQECEAEGRKPIVEVFHAAPLSPPPPTERRCRNCANFLWIPAENREMATKGKCLMRTAGMEYCDANEDLDHGWCDKWKPMEEKPKKTAKKEEQPKKEPCLADLVLSDAEHALVRIREIAEGAFDVPERDREAGCGHALEQILEISGKALEKGEKE